MCSGASFGVTFRIAPRRIRRSRRHEGVCQLSRSIHRLPGFISRVKTITLKKEGSTESHTESSLRRLPPSGFTGACSNPGTHLYGESGRGTVFFPGVVMRTQETEPFFPTGSSFREAEFLSLCLEFSGLRRYKITVGKKRVGLNVPHLSE